MAVASTPDAETQAGIIARIGDPENTLPRAIGRSWTQRQSQLALSFGLGVLYVTRDAADAKIAEFRDRTDFAMPGDLSAKDSQTWDHVVAVRAEVQAEIERLEARIAASSLPLAGVPAALPGDPYGCRPRAGNPRQVGSPYLPTFRRWP